MSNDIIEKILALATQDLRMRLEEAFEAGGAKMRRDLLTALKRDDVSFDVALARIDATRRSGRINSATARRSARSGRPFSG